MRDVYPSLRTYCQQRGLEFQVVDMRWGVRDEATADHKTSELCMQEIRNCQRLTAGPNFVVINAFLPFHSGLFGRNARSIKWASFLSFCVQSQIALVFTAHSSRSFLPRR